MLCFQIQRNEGNGKGIWYSLYGLVEHSGSLDSGHYVAYVKMRTPADINIRQFLQKSYLDRDELTDEALVQRIRTLRRQLEQNPRKNARLQSAVKGTWFRISDRNCEVRSVDQVLNCQAYLLFYERLVCSKDEGSMHSGTRSNTLFIGHF